MIRSPKRWITVGLLAAAMAAGGCGFLDRHEEKPAAVYGVVQIEKAVESHPRYSEYYRLKKEYDVMTASYRAEQMLLSKKAAMENLRLQELDEQKGITQELNQELEARMQMKENELNRKLQDVYMSLVEQHKLEQRFDQAIDESSLKIVNMQLKLRNAHLRRAERAELEAELTEAMKNRKVDYLAIGNELVGEVSQEMLPHKEAAEKELAAYRESVIKELAAERDDKMKLLEKQVKEEENLPDPAAWNQEWKEKLEKKKQEADLVYDLILADIRRKAEAVAQEKQLEMIFSQYEVNVSAMDVTDDVIAAYRK